MREIKFRVWDKKEKKIYNITEGSAFGIDYEVGIWKNGWELCSISVKGKVVVCGQQEAMGNAQMQRDDGELMQYTGLKDKNGKEIYEGDILQDIGNHEFRYEVLWGLYEWRMALNGKMQTSILRHSDQSHYEFEVIGNIYENPELLKK